MTSSDPACRVPEIWFMETGARYPGGLKIERLPQYGTVCKLVSGDVAKALYEAECVRLGSSPGIIGWRNEAVARSATQRFCRTLLLAGTERKVVAARLDLWAASQTKNELFWQTGDEDLPLADWDALPPGPAVAREDVIHPR